MFFAANDNLKKILFAYFIKMKNNYDPALLQTSYLSNETIERILNSHGTIPLLSYNSSSALLDYLLLIITFLPSPFLSFFYIGLLSFLSSFSTHFLFRPFVYHQPFIFAFPYFLSHLLFLPLLSFRPYGKIMLGKHREEIYIKQLRQMGRRRKEMRNNKGIDKGK
jgi:hypothetical protein